MLHRNKVMEILTFLAGRDPFNMNSFFHKSTAENNLSDIYSAKTTGN